MEKRGSEQTNNIKMGHTYLQQAFAILANLLTLSYGLECGWISPITKILQSESSPAGEPLSDTSIALIASALSTAAVVGVPIFAYLSEKLGSKTAVILLALPQTISWALRIIYSNSTTLLIARIITGISAGGVFNAVPMYVKEISEDSVRGVLGSLLVLSQNTGIFIMYVLGAYLDYYTVMYIAISLPIITTILMTQAPQSPAFLVKQGKLEEASSAIALLRGLQKDDKAVQKELENMRREDEDFKSLPNVSFKAIYNDVSWRRGLVIILLTFTFHGANGAYAIVTYASAILVSTGVEINISPELQTLSIPFMMIVSSLLLTVIVEKCGRKWLLSVAYFLTAVAMATLAGAILAQRHGAAVPSWVPIVAMILAVAMYSAGVSPLPYIVMTEMFNFQVRAKVMGMVVTYAWFLSFLAVALYAPVSSMFGQYTPFIFYGSVNLLGAIFVSFYLPETRGKSDAEIRKALLGSKNETKSSP